MSDPWLKFYPTNWRADPALRSCSMAARGLWMEMLCVMHEADPRGTLRVNGKPVGDRQLSSLAGCFEVPELLAELEAAGVFSREDDGTIYSRRMVRETAKAAKDKANGKTGGNPILKPADKAGDNPPDIPPDNAKNLEAIAKKEEADASSNVREIEREFVEAFWPAYPLKKGKGAALKAFRSARKLADLETILAGARRYAAERAGEDQKYTKHAQGWLNGEHWADEPAPPRSRSHGPPSADKGIVGAAHRIIESRANGSEIFPSNHGHAERLSAEPGDKPGTATEDIRGGIGRRFAGGHH